LAVEVGQENGQLRGDAATVSLMRVSSRYLSGQEKIGLVSDCNIWYLQLI
jgi:hypothetical protein